MRTASEIVIPNFSSTTAARSFTAGSIRVCTNAFAGIENLSASIVLRLHYKTYTLIRSPAGVPQLSRFEAVTKLTLVCESVGK
jgi:hypothetical protein